MKQSLIFRLASLSICGALILLKTSEISGQNQASHAELSKKQPIASEIKVVAHRGASAYGPENSLATFNQAIRMGADYIELDLQMTNDKHLIVMHDESLKRTTNVKRKYPLRSPWLVRDFRLQEIKTLDAGSWFNHVFKKKARKEYDQQHVPTLQEVLQLVKHKGNGKVGLFIELKEPNLNSGMEEKLVNILRGNEMLNQKNLIFGSLSEPSLRKLKALVPQLNIIQLYSKGMLECINVKKEFKRISDYANGVGPGMEVVTPDLIHAAHQNGLFIEPWTVNKDKDMVKLLSMGVDGEITNKPDHLALLLDLYKCSKDPKCT
ncbi:glycerophosphodiester phosphodiesterase [Bacillus sp. BRMEA1]|uniref:glycerophosphodiester phosphodiesterase family protein n=1 Tax=Neobacillus endophyticus TaxID=2738405 RepID=UPI0015673307|nr:glycerophosphodiester phosphodiesterase family protein [Neobacillus endophyticus]NRD78933.1 glycerophosphodiester phosphodiesterase [Neobacillus endophyticus]